METAAREDTALAVVNASSTVNKSVVCKLLISRRTVTVVATVVAVVDEVISELLISPGIVPVAAIAVAGVVVVIVDEADCGLLTSPGIVTVVATAVAVDVDGVGNIPVVVMICVVSLATLLVDTSGVVVNVSSVPVLVTMVAGCTELNSVGIDDNSDDNSSVE